MKAIVGLLLAGAVIAGCHSRTEAEAGAAPDRADTLVAADTAQLPSTDTTTGQADPSPYPTDTTMGEVYDTASFQGIDSTGAPGHEPGCYRDTTVMQC